MKKQNDKVTDIIVSAVKMFSYKNRNEKINLDVESLI